MSKSAKKHQKNQKKPAFPESDQSFVDRAVHLQNNIYGSDKGKLRLMILQRDLQTIMSTEKTLSVLDAGCGMGLMSEWALSFGHQVTACDNAETMVEQAQCRLAESKNSQSAQVFQSTIQELPSDKTYDVIFCHAVLEWVEDQNALLDKLSALLNDGGYLSLMFYNAWAREMAQLVYGNFGYIEKNYQVRQRVKLNPHWPAFPNVVENYLTDKQLSVKTRSGIRVFYDIMRHREHYQGLSDEIIRHELRVSQQSPYWQMGRYIHFIAQK